MYTYIHIGVDFKSKIVEDGDKRYKLQLWDTAGQERYDSLRRGFYRGAKVINHMIPIYIYIYIADLCCDVQP